MIPMRRGVGELGDLFFSLHIFVLYLLSSTLHTQTILDSRALV